MNPIVRLWYFCFYPSTAATFGASHRERHPGHFLPLFEAIIPETQIHTVSKGRVRK